MADAHAETQYRQGRSNLGDQRIRGPGLKRIRHRELKRTCKYSPGFVVIRKDFMSDFQPLTVSTADAQRLLGIKNTKLYELIGSGKLAAVKIGRKTLITSESLHRFVEQLPAAEIGSARRKKIA